MSDDFILSDEEIRTHGQRQAVQDRIVKERQRLRTVQEHRKLYAVRGQVRTEERMARREAFADTHPRLARARQVAGGLASGFVKGVQRLRRPGKEATRAHKAVIRETTQTSTRPVPTFMQRDGPPLFADAGNRGGMFDHPRNDIFERRRKLL